MDVVTNPSAGVDPQAAAAELQEFDTLLSGAPPLRNALLSPAVTPARKRAVVGRLAGAMGTSRTVRNFVMVVVNHRRTEMLPEIRQAFQTLLDERLGLVEAAVSSARELTPEQREAVAGRLSRLTGRKVRCRFAVEDGLIGGLTARIGSTIYDGSVRGQLARLRRSLVE